MAVKKKLMLLAAFSETKPLGQYTVETVSTDFGSVKKALRDLYAVSLEDMSDPLKIAIRYLNAEVPFKPSLERRC